MIRLDILLVHGYWNKLVLLFGVCQIVKTMNALKGFRTPDLKLTKLALYH
jgi:hypothetical protein